MTAEKVADPATADGEVEDSGYEPELKRTLGSFQLSAVSFAFISVAVGVFPQAFMPLPGMPERENTARLITVVILVVQAVLVISSTRLLGLITSGAVAIELGIVAVLVIALVTVMVFTASGNLDNLTSRGITADPSDYFAIGGGLMAGMIMGLTTLVGFDSAANLAEEARDPFRSVPRAIVPSVVASGVVGLLFLIALTVAIKDVPAVSDSGSPVAAIIRGQLGPVMERVLLAGIVFALFGAGMVVMAASSRQVFAMARDERFPAHRLLRRVNPRTQTPVPATVLIVVVGVVLLVALPGEALLQLIIGGTVLPALIYGAIVVLYLAVRKRLERKEGGLVTPSFPTSSCSV